MDLREYELEFIKNPYDEFMDGYEDYCGHRLLEYEDSHFVLGKFLEEVAYRLENGIDDVLGVEDALIYLGVSEFEVYEFLRTDEFTAKYVDAFNDLIKSVEGRSYLARYMLNDILDNGESGMWNDYYEAYFSGCYHYNDFQFNKLYAQIWNLYKGEFEAQGMLGRHVVSLCKTLLYGVNK